MDSPLRFRSVAVHSIHNVEGNCLVRARENRWLVHIVPKPAHAHGDKVLVKGAPPGPRRSPGEIRKDARARPDNSGVDGTVGIVREVVSRHPLIVGGIAGRLRDVEIGDHDELESHPAEVVDHTAEVGEAGLINGEGPV